MGKRPNKHNIVKPKRTANSSGSSSGLGSLRNFTNAQDIKARFWTNAASRRQAGDKANGDATYWTEGRCNWGGNHNLLEDCDTLAQWANNVVSTQYDAQELTLAINEQEFNQKKQALVNKFQDCINKCQISDSWSIGNICCIWNDYFGSFVAPFTNELKKDLQSRLNQLQTIDATHQRQILELEAELKTAETKYNDAMKQASDPNISPSEKAKFIAIAQAAERTIKQAKQKLARNPLSKLAQYSYIKDIGRFLNGNVPSSLPPRQPGNRPGSSGSGNGGSGGSAGNSGGGSSNSPWTPWQGNSGNSNNQTTNQQQLIIFGGITLIVIYFLLNQKEENSYDKY